MSADAYANAFTSGYRVWEEKWEADSPAWPIALAWTYWKQTGQRAIFAPRLHRAVWASVNVWRCEELHGQCSHYRGPRANGSQPAFNSQTGLVWTAFRPSDDAVRYHFNIPQE